MTMYYTADARMPNGAVLKRNIDFGKWLRIDLYQSRWGEAIVRNVNWICWNDFAVEASGYPDSFIWLGGDNEVIFRNDPRYMDVLAQSGLQRPRGSCNGYYRAYLGPEYSSTGTTPSSHEAMIVFQRTFALGSVPSASFGRSEPET